jgi:heat shock protein HslJ
MHFVQKLSALILAAAILSPTAFAQTVPVQLPLSDLTGPIWMWLRSEYNDDSTVVAADPSRYTVQFLADGNLAIGADCNRVTGTYSRGPSQLSIQLGATTLAACLGDSQADTFLADLSNTVTYVMSGDNLVLKLKLDTGNMILQPQAGAPASATRQFPTRVPWRIQSYNNGREAVVSVSAVGVAPDSQPAATFGDDGMVVGSTGCNTFRGPYTTSGSQLTFGPLITTRRACLSDDANAQEQAILNALAAAATFELLGDRMTVHSADGAIQLILLRPLDGAF